MKKTIAMIEESIALMTSRLKEETDESKKVALVEMIEILRGRLDRMTMIDVTYLVNKAQTGDERAHRMLIKRYGKVITNQMLQEQT